MFHDLTGVKKPVVDKDNILHWPVLLLYVEVMSSDFIEDFCETDMFSAHLYMIFSEGSPPLPWDKENAYTREAVELYYEEDCFYDLPYNTEYQIFVLHLRKTRDEIMKCTLYICRYIL